MNLAGHRHRRLSENYFEPCLYKLFEPSFLATKLKLTSIIFVFLEILREHHQASKTEKTLLPYLPIPHVRDMLIPPSDRSLVAFSFFSHVEKCNLINNRHIGK